MTRVVESVQRVVFVPPVGAGASLQVRPGRDGEVLLLLDHLGMTGVSISVRISDLREALDLVEVME